MLTGPAELARVTARLRQIHRAALGLVGIVIAMVLTGNERVALAAIIVVLVLQLVSLEGLRVLAASMREPRR